MDTTLYRKIVEALETNVAVALATVVSAEGATPSKIGLKMLVYPNGDAYGTIGGGEIEHDVIREILDNRSSAARKLRFELKGEPEVPDGTNMICGGVVEVLVEPLFNPDILYIVGGGHCAIALGKVAKMCGFRVAIIDNRAEWASREKHPDADFAICAQYDEIEKHIHFSPTTYIAIMTHGHAHDELVLRKCIRREHRYIGMIGSKRKVAQCFDNMMRDGFSKEELSRVFAPIGFDIGSQTPGEIAASIAAQIVAVKYGRLSVISE